MIERGQCPKCGERVQGHAVIEPPAAMDFKFWGPNSRRTVCRGLHSGWIFTHFLVNDIHRIAWVRFQDE